MEKRTNRLAAVQVDLAVNVAAVFGMGAGVRVLHAEGISPTIVQRVIIDGGPRRGATYPPPSENCVIRSHDGTSK